MAAAVSSAPVSATTSSRAGRTVWSSTWSVVPSQRRGAGAAVGAAGLGGAAVGRLPESVGAIRHDGTAVPAALTVSGLEKAYGSVRALTGVDLEVGEGELVGLLGPNGAGKSTLVKIACGLVTPTAGTATVCGAPAGSIQAHRELGYLAELF